MTRRLDLPIVLEQVDEEHTTVTAAPAFGSRITLHVRPYALGPQWKVAGSAAGSGHISVHSTQDLALIAALRRARRYAAACARPLPHSRRAAA